MYPGTRPSRRRWLQGSWEGPKVARFLGGSWAHTPVPPAFSPGAARYRRSPDTGRGRRGPPCRAEDRSQGRGTVTRSWQDLWPSGKPKPSPRSGLPTGSFILTLCSGAESSSEAPGRPELARAFSGARGPGGADRRGVPPQGGSTWGQRRRPHPGVLGATARTPEDGPRLSEQRRRESRSEREKTRKAAGFRARQGSFCHRPGMRCRKEGRPQTDSLCFLPKRRAWECRPVYEG